MKVSVITATWNSGKTLRTTLDSVLNQSYPDIEHIIVDGGSTDNTMEIIREYEPRYNGRLRYISEPDKGLYDAMNKGIRMATGEVVGILNSDDFYTSSDVVEKLEKELPTGWMQYMEIFISWMAMTWVNVSAIIRQDFSTVAGCDLALCPHTQVSTAAKLYMINMVALICHTRLLPILNVFYGLFSYNGFCNHAYRRNFHQRLCQP